MNVVVCTGVKYEGRIVLSFDAEDAKSTEITTLDDNEHAKYSVDTKFGLFEAEAAKDESIDSIVFHKLDLFTDQHQWCVTMKDEDTAKKIIKEEVLKYGELFVKAVEYDDDIESFKRKTSEPELMPFEIDECEYCSKKDTSFDDIVCYVGMLVRTRPCLGKMKYSYNFHKATVNSKTVTGCGMDDNGRECKYIKYETDFGVFKQMLLKNDPGYDTIFWGNCPYTAKNLQMMIVYEANKFDEEAAKIRLKNAFKQLADGIFSVED